MKTIEQIEAVLGSLVLSGMLFVSGASMHYTLNNYHGGAWTLFFIRLFKYLKAFTIGFTILTIPLCLIVLPHMNWPLSRILSDQWNVFTLISVGAELFFVFPYMFVIWILHYPHFWVMRQCLRYRFNKNVFSGTLPPMAINGNANLTHPSITAYHNGYLYQLLISLSIPQTFLMTTAAFVPLLFFILWLRIFSLVGIGSITVFMFVLVIAVCCMPPQAVRDIVVEDWRVDSAVLGIGVTVMGITDRCGWFNCRGLAFLSTFFPLIPMLIVANICFDSIAINTGTFLVCAVPTLLLSIPTASNVVSVSLPWPSSFTRSALRSVFIHQGWQRVKVNIVLVAIVCLVTGLFLVVSTDIAPQPITPVHQLFGFTPEILGWIARGFLTVLANSAFFSFGFLWQVSEDKLTSIFWSIKNNNSLVILFVLFSIVRSFLVLNLH